LDLGHRRVGLLDIEIDWLLAKYGLAAPSSLKCEIDVSVGRRADDDGIDIAAGDGGAGTCRSLATESIGQRFRGALDRIGNRDEPAARVLCHVAGMDLADSAGTKDCDSDHGFLRMRKYNMAPLPRACETVHSSGIERH